jgi:hypothetical protein
VITGLGAVTPLGNDAETSWESLITGKSGAGPITQFDSSDFYVHFACEVKDFDATDFIDRKQTRRMDRFAHLIVAAARMAEQDAGLEISKESDRVGAAIATGIGGLKAFQDCHAELLERGPDRVNPFSIPEIIPNMGAAWVSMQLGTQGPLSSQCTACAASNMAIGEGADAIRLGRADVMLCGGTEAPVTEVGIAGFSAMRALSRRNDEPEKASRPFDAGRDGFVMGEAGAVVVLEALEHAQARGAKIYAELLGYGVSSDARHITEPDPTGVNPARAMQMAFGDAGRPLPRRRRRGRGDVHDTGRRPRRAPADDQLRRAGPPVRPRLHPERGARGRRAGRRLELVRLRRPQRVHRGSPLRGLAGVGVEAQVLGEVRVPVLARVRSLPHLEADVRAVGLQLPRELRCTGPQLGRMATRDSQEVVFGEIGRVVEAELDVM